MENTEPALLGEWCPGLWTILPDLPPPAQALSSGRELHDKRCCQCIERRRGKKQNTSYQNANPAVKYSFINSIVVCVCVCVHNE